jgi:hypothetical protein
MIKHVSVLFKLLAEVLNDFSATLSNRGLIVLCILIACINMSRSMFGGDKNHSSADRERREKREFNEMVNTSD